MKKKILLLPICLMAITSCGGANNKTEDYEEEARILIERMRQATYRVTFKGTQTETFPSGYEAYDSVRDVSLIREYGYIDNDPSKLRAAREIGETTNYTYYESEDGRMYSQIIKEDNTVERSYLMGLTSYYRFAKYYASPFDFLSPEDIDETLILSSQKAYLLFNYYTGFSQPVNKAIVRLNADGLVNEIAFNFGTLPVGIETGEGSIETVDCDMTGSLTFDYDLEPIKYLEPYKEKSNKFETAVNSLGNNYTMNIDSNAAETKATAYVTEDKVFIHLDSKEHTMLANDMYYVKKGSGYRSYVYTGKEWTRDETVDISAVLPDIKSLSPYLFEDKSENHMSLKSEATSFGADNFILPMMGITEGTGLSAEVYTRGDKLDYVSTTFFFYTGNIAIKNTYTNQGTTTLPLWLEEPEA